MSPTGVYQRPPAETRFWCRVDIDEPGVCWFWMGPITAKGYGVFSAKPTFSTAHRYSYFLAHGSIPEGLHIDHLCGNRQCVNPEHLEAVTQRENNIRGNGFSGINARKVACANGHPFTEENTLWTRRCRECSAQHSRNSYYRRRAMT